MKEAKHSGCFYCGQTDQETLQSVVKHTIDPKGKTETQHSAGKALCDTCVKLPVLDLRIPLNQRQAMAA